MSKKTSQSSYKKNKSKSKDRFLESIITQANSSEEVIPSPKNLNIEGSTAVTTITSASKFGLTTELTYIGIISSVLVTVLIATSFAI